MTLLITGGAGFIGCNFAKIWLASETEPLVNIDKLTYAGNEQNIQTEKNHPHYEFIRADIGDETAIKKLLDSYKPRAVINFAAESHVDRALTEGDNFIGTNIMATYNFLKRVYDYWQNLEPQAKEQFRFIQISTDEVYGALPSQHAPPFTEQSPNLPSSLYSASKAAADSLAHAYYRTYGLPVMITRSSNNYGPFQFPEKLIPLMVSRALAQESLPIYGDGKNIRDWIHVSDNCRAIITILKKGVPGEIYNIGAKHETDNISLVRTLCQILDELHPAKQPYEQQIEFISDRPGHDFRYAMNIDKITAMGWRAQCPFQQGLADTIRWYTDNRNWTQAVMKNQTPC